MPSGGSARHRVLIVDDEPQIREIVRDALALVGYDVIEAAGGAQALAILTHDAPDAILLDLWMPDIDGWAFRRVQLESHPEIPLIVFSAVDVSPSRLAELRPDGILRKPFDLNDLYASLARVLAGRTTT